MGNISIVVSQYSLNIDPKNHPSAEDDLFGKMVVVFATLSVFVISLLRHHFYFNSNSTRPQQTMQK